MIKDLLDKIDIISNDFIINGYNQMVQTYSPAIYGLVTLFIIILGYSALTGWINLSFSEVSKRILLVGFVLVFALDWGVFSAYIYGLFTDVPNEISSSIIKSLPGSSLRHVGDVNTALDQTLIDSVDFFNALWERGAWNNVLPYIYAVGLWVLMLLLVGIALIELVVSKFGIAVLLVISPLMVPMLLFRQTKEIVFDGWLKHLVGFAFIPIFVTAALALGLSVVSSSVTDIQNAIANDDLGMSVLIPYSIYSIVCIGLVIKATHMATSLANSLALSMAPQVARTANTLRNEINRMRPFQPRQPKRPNNNKVTTQPITRNPDSIK